MAQDFVYDLDWWRYLLDCCSRGYLDGIDAMKVQKVTKSDSLVLAELDLRCFPDLEPFALWGSGVTKVGYGVQGHILAYGHLIAGCIDRIGVHPDYQRRGLGTQVLKSLVSAARRQHLTRVYTHIERSNASSLLLFLKTEFRTVGRVAGVHWINMERQI